MAEKIRWFGDIREIAGQRLSSAQSVPVEQATRTVYCSSADALTWRRVAWSGSDPVSTCTSFSTFFLHNRPQLELIRRLVRRRTQGSMLKVAILGCSKGAEACSVARSIRTERPDLQLILHAVDISRQAIQIGKRGCYSVVTPELTSTNVFDRLTMAEIDEFFDIDGDIATGKGWAKEGIEWIVGDAGDPEIVETLGSSYNIGVANNFLCHMDVPMAVRALRNISRLTPHGYLFFS